MREKKTDIKEKQSNDIVVERNINFHMFAAFNWNRTCIYLLWIYEITYSEVLKTIGRRSDVVYRWKMANTEQGKLLSQPTIQTHTHTVIHTFKRDAIMVLDEKYMLKTKYQTTTQEFICQRALKVTWENINCMLTIKAYFSILYALSGIPITHCTQTQPYSHPDVICIAASSAESNLEHFNYSYQLNAVRRWDSYRDEETENGKSKCLYVYKGADTVAPVPLPPWEREKEGLCAMGDDRKGEMNVN